MYKIIKNVIESKDYVLEDILYKIDKMYIQDRITEAEKTELDSLARQNAKAENSYAPLQEQINTLFKEIAELKAIINKDTEEPTEQEEYPPFKQPTGSHDSYNTGDKITDNGKKYICKMDNCVWAPDVYPAGWEEVIEEVEQETTEENVEVEE